jgi:gamma-glutamyltranspeptidase/glutathione hydrolase
VLGYALRSYGTIPLARALQCAIQAAEEGFEVGDLFHALCRRELKKFKTGNAAAFFLKGPSRPYPLGSVLRQPVLATTLHRLADAGVEDFYTGHIARMIHEDMELNGGLVRDDDLAQIPWPIERKPVGSRFQGMQVLTFPPPGAGRVLLEMLHILESAPPKLWDLDSLDGALIATEVIRQAAQDRNDRPFDPSFYPQVEDRHMLNREYAKLVARRIRKRVRGIRRVRTYGDTTHLSVMDRFGNAVAMTQSIERVFGSFAVTPELGFLYNNYMMAFEHEDMTHPYYMRPGAVPWASVAPTIVFRNRKPRAVLGSPGSERIVSSIFQVLIRMLRQSPYEAVWAPRPHCSVSGKVSLDASRFRNDIPETLARLGYEIDERDPFSFYLGCVQLVTRDRKGFTGVADPRRDGTAGGPAT